MPIKTNSLQQDALELSRLNRLVVKNVAESNLSELGKALDDYVEIKKRVKTKLLDTDTPKIHDKEALKILQKLSEGEKLQADKILAIIEKEEGLQDNFTDLGDYEIESLGDELFYSWFSHYEYICALYRLGSLVVSISVPDHLRRFVSQAKNCYAFQQYGAVYSMCRTILESAVRDICLRRRLISKRHGNAINIEEYRWCDLRDAVATGKLRTQIRDLYSELSSLIHGRKIISKEEAKQAFESTLKAVHALYAYHNY